MKKAADNKSPLLSVFVGDPFIRQRKIKVFIDQILPADLQSLQVERTDLKDVTLQQIIQKAKSFPMMGGSQVFRIRSLRTIKSADLEVLASYFSEQPADWSFFIFELDDLDAKNPLGALVARHGLRVDCVISDRASGLNLIHQKLKLEDRTMTKEAWQLLQERTSGNLSLLDACVDKLILYTKGGAVIHGSDVQKLAEEYLVYDSFDLTDAIAEKNPEKSLRIFRHLTSLGVSPVELIGLLNWQLKRIWQAKNLLRSDGEPGMLKKLGISNYRRGIFMQQVSRFKDSDLERGISTLFHLDRQMKTGVFLEGVALEVFLIELASPQKEPQLRLLQR